MKKFMSIVLALALFTAVSALPVFAADYVDYLDADYTGNYWDDLWIDDEHVANSLPVSPDQYISNNGGLIDNSDGSISEISVRGWVGFTQEIKAMGYCVDDGDMVEDANAFEEAPDEGILAAAGEYGTRFKIVIPVGTIAGSHTITIVAKLADGTLVKINNETQPSLNMVIEYEGPETAQEPEEKPDDNPTQQEPDKDQGNTDNNDTKPDNSQTPSTGDADAAAIAAVLVLALSAAVVLRRKVTE